MLSPVTPHPPKPSPKTRPVPRIAQRDSVPFVRICPFFFTAATDADDACCCGTSSSLSVTRQGEGKRLPSRDVIHSTTLVAKALCRAAMICSQKLSNTLMPPLVKRHKHVFWGNGGWGLVGPRRRHALPAPATVGDPNRQLDSFTAAIELMLPTTRPAPIPLKGALRLVTPPGSSRHTSRTGRSFDRRLPMTRSRQPTHTRSHVFERHLITRQ